MRDYDRAAVLFLGRLTDATVRIETCMNLRVQRVFISFSTYEFIRAWGRGYASFLPLEGQGEEDPGEVIHFRGLTLIPNDKVVGDEFWCEFGGLFG